jgi:hypothetical protein
MRCGACGNVGDPQAEQRRDDDHGDSGAPPWRPGA